MPILSAQPDPDGNVVHGVFQVFDRREDDFSLSLGLAEDPIFWLRCVKDSTPGPMILTDFNAGDQSGAVMVRALKTLFSERLEAGASELIFHDLVPCDQEPALYRIELTRVSQRVRFWAESAARLAGRTAACTRLETMNGKARLVMRLD